MSFKVEQVRERFPALKRTYKDKSVTYFDGPGGTQFLDSAVESVCGYMSGGAANLGGSFPTSHETEKLITKARDDVKLLFNASSHEVAFGPNATTMMFHVSRAISKEWEEGDEIILSELEHHSNIDSWLSAAMDKKVSVKYIPLDIQTLTLDLSVLPSLITAKTKLIAVGAASNCIGTITDIKYISRLIKDTEILLVVDAVHAIPHSYVDMEDLEIDMLFSSAYKFFAAHVGMAVIRKDLFENLSVYKVSPASDAVPNRLEIGTQNHEGIPSVSASVEFLASLGEGNSLKEQIISAYKALEEYENGLADYIRAEMVKIKGIKLYQAGETVPKTPTIAFRADGISPKEFCIRMCEEHSVFIASGDFYAMTLAEKLGIRDSGSFIRAGLAPYNTMEEANRFLDGVRAIMDSVV